MDRFLNIFIITLLSAAAEGTYHQCASDGSPPIVRNIPDMEQSHYGRLGLSHITIAGATMHGLKEVEVWFQTVAPGLHAPIHRHSCEEVFVILKGSGTFNIAPDSHKNPSPGKPQGLPIFPNSTIYVPPNDAHQIWNTNEHEDLQMMVVISRPPLKPYVYDDWDTPHTEAKLHFPYHWDERCYQQAPAIKKDVEL